MLISLEASFPGSCFSQELNRRPCRRLRFDRAACSLLGIEIKFPEFRRRLYREASPMRSVGVKRPCTRQAPTGSRGRCPFRCLPPLYVAAPRLRVPFEERWLSSASARFMRACMAYVPAASQPGNLLFDRRPQSLAVTMQPKPTPKAWPTV